MRSSRNRLAGLLVVSCVASGIGSAVAQSECAPVVRAGKWQLTSGGEVRSNVGPGKANAENTIVPVETDCSANTIKLLAGPGDDDDVTLDYIGDNTFQGKVEFVQGTSELTFYMRAIVDSPTEFGVTISASKGAWHSARTDFRYSYLGDAERRPECGCRDKLEEFIVESIAEAKAFRDQYAKKAYWKRPAALPPDPPNLKAYWTPQNYDTLISEMVGGRSYAEAVQVVVDGITGIAPPPNSGPGTSGGAGGTAGGGSGDEASYIAAKTNMSTCTVEYGNAHEYECFPDLALESTQEHEGTHVTDCKEQPFTQWALVPNHAMNEVRGYQKEIDFLGDWIEDNCGE